MYRVGVSIAYRGEHASPAQRHGQPPSDLPRACASPANVLLIHYLFGSGYAGLGLKIVGNWERPPTPTNINIETKELRIDLFALVVEKWTPDFGQAVK